MWRVWKNIFNNVVNRHAPLRSKRVRASKSPWVTKRFKQLMHQGDSLKLKAIRSIPNVWLDFKKKRNIVNNEIKKAKKAYYLKEFCENAGNSKKTWKIINELTSRKHNNPQIKEISLNGSVVTGCQKLFEAFNDHFASIGPKLSNKIHGNGIRSYSEYLTCCQNGTTLQLKQTRPSIVLSLLSKLSVSKL